MQPFANAIKRAAQLELKVEKQEEQIKITELQMSALKSRLLSARSEVSQLHRDREQWRSTLDAITADRDRLVDVQIFRFLTPTASLCTLGHGVTRHNS